RLFRSRQAGEGRGLDATRENRVLLRVAGADAGEPIGGDAHRLVPFDLAKPAFATLAHAQQRLLQPRRAKVLHDAGIALATEHAAVDRVVAVARNVADGAVLKVHVDAAAAGAHVAGGLGDAVADRGRRVH